MYGIVIAVVLIFSRTSVGFDCPSNRTSKTVQFPNLTEYQLSRYRENTIRYNISFTNVSSGDLVECPFRAIFSKYVLSLDLSNKSLALTEERPFRSLRCLLVLDLSRNNISNISAHSFSGLSNLLYLNLSGNTLNELSNGTFSELISLEVLDLSRNYIKQIYTTSFDGTKNLQVLMLSHNKMKTISYIFDNLIHLKRLSMDYNSIAILDCDIFRNNSELEILDLSNGGLLRLGNLTKGKFNTKTLSLLNLSSNDMSEIDVVGFNIFRNATTIIDLNDNRVCCNELKPAIEQLRDAKVSIAEGRSHGAQRNFDGILCDDTICCIPSDPPRPECDTSNYMIHKYHVISPVAALALALSGLFFGIVLVLDYVSGHKYSQRLVEKFRVKCAERDDVDYVQLCRDR